MHRSHCPPSASRRNEIGNTQFDLQSRKYEHMQKCANCARESLRRDAQLREATAVRRKAGASYADRTLVLRVPESRVQLTKH